MVALCQKFDQKKFHVNAISSFKLANYFAFDGKIVEKVYDGCPSSIFNYLSNVFFFFVLFIFKLDSMISIFLGVCKFITDGNFNKPLPYNKGV